MHRGRSFRSNTITTSVATLQSAIISGAPRHGRVGDARLSFIANSSMGVTRNSSRPTLQGGTVRLDRPNGQSFVGGEFGTGTDVEFLSAARPRRTWSNCLFIVCDLIFLAGKQLPESSETPATSNLETSGSNRIRTWP